MLHIKQFNIDVLVSKVSEIQLDGYYWTFLNIFSESLQTFYFSWFMFGFCKKKPNFKPTFQSFDESSSRPDLLLG